MKSRAKGQVELQKLIFTMNWEDPESDHKALSIQPGDTLMTITSGGCNTLDFLLYDPKMIHSVDINPAQSFLLELKMAAMGHFEYPEFVRFLGITPSEDRLKNYCILRKHLTVQAAEFWDAHQEIIQNGFIYCGRYEYFVKLVGKFIHFIQGKKRVDRLFDDRDMEEQRAYYDRYWNIKRTRMIFNMFFNKYVLARRGLKADYFHFDDGSNTFAESFFRKFRKVVHDIPIKGNYFLHLYLEGRYRSLEEVPGYLKQENFQTIKQRLERIQMHSDDAKKWLTSMPANTFECMSLSNICELMSLDDTLKMFQEVLRTAKPDARICFRNLILPREVPEVLRGHIRKDERLSQEMMNTDRSFVYSKVAAYQVKK
jgi:S-adenosylmethionine-diacylglycerol 3-amino-3-carboxypropyl transferase